MPRSEHRVAESRDDSEGDLAFLDGLSASIAGRRRLVIVPVGRFDLRATKPAEHVWRIAAAERRAVHVTADKDRVWELADAWMGRRMPLPLQVVENAGGVAPTLARLVEFELAAGFDEVVVVVGRVGLSERRQHLWHDRTADSIARLVGENPRALVGLMTVATI